MIAGVSMRDLLDLRGALAAAREGWGHQLWAEGCQGFGTSNEDWRRVIRVHAGGSSSAWRAGTVWRRRELRSLPGTGQSPQLALGM